MYDVTTRKFLGVKEFVGYIMIRNQEDEVFLSYGYSSEHSTSLYCYQKQPIPNIFRGTAFNSHKLSNYLDSKAEILDICFYLPSITDRKEDINRYKDMVSLIPVTSTISDISVFLQKVIDLILNIWIRKEKILSVLEKLCTLTLKILPNNSNLIQNCYALMKKEGIAHSSLKWAPFLPQSKVDYSKFSLDHS